MINCPYCGSHRLQTGGDMDGNPFNSQSEKMMCLDCGRMLPGSDISDNDLFGEVIEERRPIIVVEMTATAAGVTRSASIKIPYKDGNYPLRDYDYPFPRFDRIIIDCDRLDLDGEISKITSNTLETEKHFIAYGLDRYGWDETVKIKIYKDIE